MIHFDSTWLAITYQAFSCRRNIQYCIRGLLLPTPGSPREGFIYDPFPIHALILIHAASPLLCMRYPRCVNKDVMQMAAHHGQFYIHM